MSIDVQQERMKLARQEKAAKTRRIMLPLAASLCFYILSYTILPENAGFDDRAWPTLIALFLSSVYAEILNSMFERHSVLLRSILFMHELNKQPTVHNEAAKESGATPETRPAPPIELIERNTVESEAVAKVKIPSEPKLPEIPSVGVPAEVKEALKAGKTKTESVAERTATDNTAKKVTVKKKTKA
jgi:hypothetical protein